MRMLAAALGLALATNPAMAAEIVDIQFTDGDVVDQFIVQNIAPCSGVAVDEVAIDLTSAPSGIRFDSVPGGAGYVTGQGNASPFQISEGQTFVTDVPRLEDGGTNVTLLLKEFTPGSRLVLTLDVDSPEGAAATGSAQDDAAGLKLEGATVAAKIINSSGTKQGEIGAFGSENHATVAWDAACPAS